MSDRKLKQIPYEFKDLDPEINKMVSKQFSDDLTHLVQIGPQKMIIPGQFINEALASYCYEFPFRQNDVLVMGFPRSGTTITQELLWLLFNDFNIKVAAKKTIHQRVPLLESKSLLTKKFKSTASKFALTTRLAHMMSAPKILEEMTRRRVIKTHLPFDFLPENLLSCGCKVIYVARNPKDVIVSRYNFHTSGLIEGYNENFEVLFGPYWSHLAQGWERRFSKNVFFFYENFLKNRREYIEKIIEFEGEKVTPLQLDLLDFTLEFKNFKNYIAQSIDKKNNSRENTNTNFIRIGAVGGWKEYFTEEMNSKVNNWIEENLARTGIELPESSF